MIHPHTYIHPNAKLATNVKVDPFSVIHQNVEIGDGTWIGSNVTIMEGAKIGKNCRIFPGAVISAIPQDLKFEGEITSVEIGDNTTIREFVTVNRGSKDKWTTKIGSNCLLMAYSHVAHDCIIGNNCILSNNTQMAGHVIMGDYAILAGMCAVHQFVNIGQHAYVGGGSLVGKDVPPYIKAGRTPLSYAGVNSVGLKRRGFSLDRINKILDIYRIIYNKAMNTIQAIITFLFLSKEILQIRFDFDKKLWKQMMIYSLPLIIAGMGGMINETFDRLMLKWWLPGKNADTEIGIYNACYKLSILISLFIQAFRMGAEPFFFKQAEGKNPQRTYARVMKFFVIVITVMFLVVSLYIPIWRNFIGPKYWAGLTVVPILLLANMFLGIYYNLSVWYKLGNKTIAGAWITLIGTAITIIINYLFIPAYSYTACAWATFFCYGSMMVVSYVWGQKEYPVPYVWKKLIAYIIIVVLLFFIHRGIVHFLPKDWFSLLIATLLTGIYIWFIGQVEKKELPNLPMIGKYFR